MATKDTSSDLNEHQLLGTPSNNSNRVEECCVNLTGEEDFSTEETSNKAEAVQVERDKQLALDTDIAEEKMPQITNKKPQIRLILNNKSCNKIEETSATIVKEEEHLVTEEASKCIVMATKDTSSDLNEHRVLGTPSNNSNRVEECCVNLTGEEDFSTEEASNKAEAVQIKRDKQLALDTDSTEEEMSQSINKKPQIRLILNSKSYNKMEGHLAIEEANKCTNDIECLGDEDLKRNSDELNIVIERKTLLVSSNEDEQKSKLLGKTVSGDSIAANSEPNSRLEIIRCESKDSLQSERSLGEETLTERNGSIHESLSDVNVITTEALKQKGHLGNIKSDKERPVFTGSNDEKISSDDEVLDLLSNNESENIEASRNESEPVNLLDSTEENELCKDNANSKSLENQEMNKSKCLQKVDSDSDLEIIDIIQYQSKTSNVDHRSDSNETKDMFLDKIQSEEEIIKLDENEDELLDNIYFNIDNETETVEVKKEEKEESLNQKMDKDSEFIKSDDNDLIDLNNDIDFEECHNLSEDDENKEQEVFLEECKKSDLKGHGMVNYTDTLVEVFDLREILTNKERRSETVEVAAYQSAHNSLLRKQGLSTFIESKIARYPDIFLNEKLTSQSYPEERFRGHPSSSYGNLREAKIGLSEFLNTKRDCHIYDSLEHEDRGSYEDYRNGNYSRTQRSRINSRTQFCLSSRDSWEDRNKSYVRSKSRECQKRLSLKRKHRSRSPVPYPEKKTKHSREDAAVENLWDIHKRECDIYRRNPEAHPDYSRLKRMWYDVMVSQGLKTDDIHLHEQWKEYWPKKMEEIFKYSWEEKKEKCLSLLRKTEDSKSMGNDPNHMSVEELETHLNEYINNIRVPKVEGPFKAGLTDTLLAESSSHSSAISRNVKLLAVTSILSQISDKFGALEVSLTLLHRNVLQAHQQGQNALEYIDEDARMLLDLVLDKIKRLLSDSSLSLVQRTMVQEAHNQLLPFLELLGKKKGYFYGLDIDVLAKSTLGMQVNDIVNYVKSNLSRKGVHNPSNEQLMGIYAEIKSEQMKLMSDKGQSTSRDSPDISKSIHSGKWFFKQ